MAVIRNADYAALSVLIGKPPRASGYRQWQILKAESITFNHGLSTSPQGKESSGNDTHGGSPVAGTTAEGKIDLAHPFNP
jgi:hypothetical protein